MFFVLAGVLGDAVVDDDATRVSAKVGTGGKKRRIIIGQKSKEKISPTIETRWGLLQHFRGAARVIDNGGDVKDGFNNVLSIFSCFFAGVGV